MAKKRGPIPKYDPSLIRVVNHLYYRARWRNILGMPGYVVADAVNNHMSPSPGLVASQVPYIASLALQGSQGDLTPSELELIAKIEAAQS